MVVGWLPIGCRFVADRLLIGSCLVPDGGAAAGALGAAGAVAAAVGDAGGGGWVGELAGWRAGRWVGGWVGGSGLRFGFRQASAAMEGRNFQCTGCFTF